MPDVVASKAQSQLRELSGSTFGFTTQGFSMHGGRLTRGTSKNLKTVKIGGWVLDRVWALVRDNTVDVNRP